jgi:rhodanese-related sulfurtransferase
MIDTLPSMSVSDLARLRKSGDAPVILDVREQWERDIALLPDSLHIALQSLPAHISELPLDRPIVVMCHHGGRSAQATAWLRQNGFAATNLEGGIDAWAESVDRSVPRY